MMPRGGVVVDSAIYGLDIGIICAAVKGIMVFKQFSVGWGIAIRAFGSRTRYHFPGN